MRRITGAVGIFILLSCSNDPAPIDCSVSDLALENVFSALIMPTDCSTPDGSVQVLASGGTGSYQYAVNSSPFQSSGIFVGLAPGIYSFTVRDKNNCEAILTNITLMTSDFEYSAEVTENTNCVGGNGSITVNVQEGQPPYQYKFGDGSYGSANEFTGLQAGNYRITVKDNTNCIAELNITVGQGVTNTSWLTEILPIMQNSCATTGCHDGVARTDLRIYANAKANATLIKTYTQNGYMPFEGTITAGEKAKIACWVDEGAGNN